MSTISGKKREPVEFSRKVGLFEGTVVAINPDITEYKEQLGIELNEDSKSVEYLGESRDGNTTLRVDFWMETKDGEKFRVSFFLEDKVRSNKDGTKIQYINNIGVCSWAEDPNDLPDWFKKREYREAHVGEEELYEFIKTWLGKLDVFDNESILEFDWKQLMKGNLNDIKNEIGGEWCTNVVAMATIVTKEKDDGEIKEYQGVYNKAFLPVYSLKHFKMKDYDNPDVIKTLTAKKTKDLKIHEKFVLKVTGEYGCEDYFILKELSDYDPSANFAASKKTISETSSEY